MQRRRHKEWDEFLWALVPVKALAGAKQRLKSCLGPDRAGFTIAMFEDVLNALADSREVAHTAVVTADSRMADIAASRGVRVIEEIESRGMNAAIELGIDAIRRMGGHRVVILPADIPLVTGSEIDGLLHALEVEQLAGGNSVIGLSASADGRGTNFLCLGTNRKFQTRYGRNSYRLHREGALESQYRPVALHSRTVSIDIDRERDLDELISFCRLNPRHQDTESWKFLRKKGLINDAGEPARGYRVE